VKVTGGTTVDLTINATQATVNTTTTAGAVTVTGGATTTAVTVTETTAVTAAAKVAGIANGAVTVTDSNYFSTTSGTIASVTARGYTTLNINDSALTTLSLVNGSSDITIYNSDAVTSPVKTLGLTANGLTGGNLVDAGVYTALNVTTATANSTLANITFGAAKTWSVAGDHVLTLSSAAGLSALTTITVTGSAGLTANTGIAGTVTKIDASATSGNNAVTLNPAVSTYSGGSGVDTVTVSTAAPTKLITGGAGMADELVLNLAAGTLANPSGNAFIGGFETLGFGAAATGTYNGSGFTTVHFGSATLTGAVVVNNLAAGTALLINADPGQDVTYTLADATGSADSVNLTIGKVAVASTALAGTNTTVSGIETINLTAAGDGTGTDTVKLVDTSAKALTISGGSAVTVTLAGATALASVDASAQSKLVNIAGVALGTSGATVTAGAGGITLALGTGADTINLTGSSVAVDTVKVADGASIPVSYDTITGFSNFATGTVAGDLSDHLVFTTNAPAALHADVTVATAVPTPLDTQVVITTNVNYKSKNGLITFGGSGLSAATLPQLIGAAESIADNFGIDQVVAFQFGSDTYLVHSQHVAIASSAPGNAADSVDHDSVIKLVGVTGITSIDVTGAAAGTHVLMVA
jgi:S-layer protein